MGAINGWEMELGMGWICEFIGSVEMRTIITFFDVFTNLRNELFFLVEVNEPFVHRDYGQYFIVIK